MRKIKDTEKTTKNEDDFINAVDNLDPNAPRKFKQISLPLNEYEYRLLEEASKKEGRSQKNFLRLSLIDKSKSILN